MTKIENLYAGLPSKLTSELVSVLAENQQVRIERIVSTGPIARTAALIAGHGYVVAVPEVYHEYAEPGEAFAYDQAGTERGNTLKTTKSVSAYDADCDAMAQAILNDSACNGSIASMGICLGGHFSLIAGR